MEAGHASPAERAQLGVKIKFLNRRHDWRSFPQKSQSPRSVQLRANSDLRQPVCNMPINSLELTLRLSRIYSPLICSRGGSEKTRVFKQLSYISVTRMPPTANSQWRAETGTYSPRWTNANSMPLFKHACKSLSLIWTLLSCYWLCFFVSYRYYTKELGLQTLTNQCQLMTNQSSNIGLQILDQATYHLVHPRGPHGFVTEFDRSTLLLFRILQGLGRLIRDQETTFTDVKWCKTINDIEATGFPTSREQDTSFFDCICTFISSLAEINVK